MEEYIYSDVTAEDEAVLAAEEIADQEEGLSGLDDDLGAEAVSEVPGDENAPAETPETDAEADDTAAPAEAAEPAASDPENETADETLDDAPAGDEESPKRQPRLVTVVGVRFRTAGKAYYFSPGPYKVRHSMHVIVETARGVEYGTVVTMPMEIDKRKIKSPLKEILRPATPEDDATHIENRRKEREAYKVCYKKIREHKMDMKLIDAEYTFDHSKILFYFTADGRIDFRDLVKDLAGVFKTRIELRQIGVRDETKILGGYGSCGRPLCCHTYLSDFVPVSIKMAKEQNLSLNPTKISGVCGRLMCCLKNEQETYEELNKNLPRQGDEVEGPDGLQGEVESVNVLRQKVRILVEIDDEKELHEYNADEITMIRRRKRGEAKHRSKRIENGQEGADELRKSTRKGARPDRPARQDDAERGNRAEGGERQGRDNYRDGERQGRGDGERQGRDNYRDSDRQGRGGDGERGQNQGDGQERGGRRSEGRRGGRGSREDRQNAAREHGDRENGAQERGGREGQNGRDGQNGRGGRGGRNRGNRNAEGGSNQDRTESGNVENTGRGAENGGADRGNRGDGNGQERQNGGRSRHRRGGRGRGERQDGQNNAAGQNQNGGSHES